MQIIYTLLFSVLFDRVIIDKKNTLGDLHMPDNSNPPKHPFNNLKSLKKFQENKKRWTDEDRAFYEDFANQLAALFQKKTEELNIKQQMNCN